MLTSCRTSTSTTNSKNEIEVGEYSFQFPDDFKLIKETGIDSYVGKVSNGLIEFRFDYGYYSNKLDKSINEYLSEDVWKWNALGKNDLLPEGDIKGYTDNTHLIKYETVDSINYRLFFLYEKDTIEYELVIPEDIRETKIEIDTVDNVVYKLVRSPDYIGLYAKNLKGYSKSINSYKALSITASKLNNKQTEIALEILQSCKLNK